MKTFIMLAALLLGQNLVGGEFRIDIRAKGVDLEFQKGSESVRGQDTPWMKEKRKQRLEVYGNTSDKWEERSFTFVAKKDVTVDFLITAPYTKAGLVPKVSAYDKFSAEGATFKNGSFEKIHNAGWILEWNGKDRVMTSVAADGENYVVVSFQKKLFQKLTCRGGVPVTVTFMVKSSVW
jgi:hypothetical protein